MSEFVTVFLACSAALILTPLLRHQIYSVLAFLVAAVCVPFGITVEQIARFMGVPDDQWRSGGK
jgi:hypothetical protein